MIGPDTSSDTRQLMAAEVEAGIQWRAHWRICPVCERRYAACGQGKRLVRAMRAARSLRRLAHRSPTGPN